jgi:hypothetical protein
MAAAEGEGKADGQKKEKERSPEFIVTIGEHRQLVAYSRSMRKKDGICR